MEPDRAEKDLKPGAAWVVAAQVVGRDRVRAEDRAKVRVKVRAKDKVRAWAANKVKVVAGETNNLLEIVKGENHAGIR